MSVGLPDPAMRRPWYHSFLAGLFLALVALAVSPLAGLDLRSRGASENGELTAATLFAGVCATGWLVWALLPARPGGNSIRRGGIAGVVTACLAYPVVLLLPEFFQADWQGVDATTFVGRVLQVLLLSLLALVTTGFASALLLGIAGILAGTVESRLLPQRQARVSHRPSLAGRIIRALGWVIIGLVGVLMLSFALLTFWPIRPLDGPAPSAMALTHENALAAFAGIEAAEAALDLDPRCTSKLLTHGSKVERVVIFYHGLTNCPAQASELAPLLFEQGYNVLVPRLPGHREADTLTLALADVTAEDFVATAEGAVAMAHGLGDEVVVLGLSAGGTITAYHAQTDATLTSAVSAAPFLAPAGLPGWATQAATNLLLFLPNLMLWWDASAPWPSQPPMDYAYPRFATHALAELMRLGLVVSDAAGVTPAQAAHLGLLLNASDTSINNGAAQALAAAWQRKGAMVDNRMLPAELGLPHDIVDPRQADANTAVVYPILLDMVSADPNSPPR
ncbi:alpha/beta hydrolase [Devosia sediminis]|uniref:Alpha/beta fold hydrolase n=1 Tax=Devosia sediminis TaxID=2798801 RepID=A0A934J1C0_9HYPH|nr:alpha/beta fold hydrolase [Devosia sediminis]MBJ3785819.1 alpha/beta fold hydrolase [Devosia sediminis]